MRGTLNKHVFACHKLRRSKRLLRSEIYGIQGPASCSSSWPASSPIPLQLLLMELPAQVISQLGSSVAARDLDAACVQFAMRCVRVPANSLTDTTIYQTPSGPNDSLQQVQMAFKSADVLPIEPLVWCQPSKTRTESRLSQIETLGCLRHRCRPREETVGFKRQ